MITCGTILEQMWSIDYVTKQGVDIDHELNMLMYRMVRELALDNYPLIFKTLARHEHDTTPNLA